MRWNTDSRGAFGPGAHVQTDIERFDTNALVIGFFIQMPMITQVLPVNGVILTLKKAAFQRAGESTVILDSEGPAIEQRMAVGAQA